MSARDHEGAEKVGVYSTDNKTTTHGTSHKSASKSKSSKTMLYVGIAAAVLVVLLLLLIFVFPTA